MNQDYEYADEAQPSSHGSFTAGLLFGAIAGAAVALLFAPRAGSELRGQLSESATDIKRRASRGYSQAKDTYERAKEGYSRASDKVHDVADRAHAFVDDVRGRVSERAERVAEKVQSFS